jgi:hypothetical protein
VATTYALHASASFHGRVVEETFVRSGEAVEIGSTRELAVPVPEGREWLARVLWTGTRSCVVKDGEGGTFDLEPGHDVVIDTETVRLRLSLVPRVRLAWMEPWSIRGSLAWFAVVLMASVLAMQAVWVEQYQCVLATSFLPGVGDVGGPVLWALAPVAAFAIAVGALVMSTELRRVGGPFLLAAACLLLPVGYTVTGATWMTGDELLANTFGFCFPPDPTGGPSSHRMSAEYLARLLRKDFEGEEQGVFEERIERPPSEKKAEREFLPAGSLGPVTKMGGAEDTARRPVRTVVEESRIRPKRRTPEVPLVTTTGEPVKESPPEDDDKDGVADGAEAEAEDQDRDPAEAPAEEERGWGVPDWYDEEDQAMDNLEIQLALQIARRRLAIDPNDPTALSILSYYQYLAEDYTDALRTYDKFIALYPEEAAGYNNKALVYKRLGDYRKEEGLYREALAIEPLDETALNNLAVNLAHQGRYDEALAVMQQLETIDPKDPYADLHRSKIHAQMGQDEEAFRYLETALEGMNQLDTLHHIEFRQDIRLDPSFAKLRESHRFRAILTRYYGKDSPLQE